MVGEGHAFDMIRRMKEGREASRLRRERANEKLKHLNQLIAIAVILWAVFIK